MGSNDMQLPLEEGFTDMLSVSLRHGHESVSGIDNVTCSGAVVPSWVMALLVSWHMVGWVGVDCWGSCVKGRMVLYCVLGVHHCWKLKA